MTSAGELTRLTTSAVNASYPAWMPDSVDVLFSSGFMGSGGLWRMPASGVREPARLPFVGDSGQMPVVSRSESGTLARLLYAQSSNDPNIWRIEVPARRAQAVPSPATSMSSTRSDTLGDLSPDGSRVVFASDRSGELALWVANLDGSNATQILPTKTGELGAARWSPDGRLIACQSNLEGQYDIYVLSAAGGRPRRLTADPSNDHVPSFSRDGRWIYFGSMRTGGDEIWKRRRRAERLSR